MNTMSTNNMTDAKELFIKMAIMAWDTHIDRMNKLLDELTDEQLAAQTATGRNTGIYLLGHLTAVHDRIIPLLDKKVIIVLVEADGKNPIQL